MYSQSTPYARAAVRTKKSTVFHTCPTAPAISSAAAAHAAFQQRCGARGGSATAALAATVQSAVVTQGEEHRSAKERQPETQTNS